jgi:hypothetical protein
MAGEKNALMKAKVGLGIAGAALTLGVATPASGAVILGLYNTGVDASTEVVLPAGSAEQNYRITSSTNPLLAPALLLGEVVPFVTSGLGTNWSPNDASSAWITPFVNADGTAGGTGTPFGVPITYNYVLKFNLGTLSAASAMLTGRVQSDNSVNVWLNTTLIGGQVQDPLPPYEASFFRNFTAFSTGGGFVNGENTLRFEVTDYGVISGLRVDQLAGTAVPEPGIWAMLIIGFGLLAGQIRRRRRVAPLALA